MRLDPDSPVTCADPAFGEPSDIIIDPGTWRVACLVAQPPEHDRRAWLMPVSRVSEDEVER